MRPKIIVQIHYANDAGDTLMIIMLTTPMLTKKTLVETTMTLKTLDRLVLRNTLTIPLFQKCQNNEKLGGVERMGSKTYK